MHRDLYIIAAIVYSLYWDFVCLYLCDMVRTCTTRYLRLNRETVDLDVEGQAHELNNGRLGYQTSLVVTQQSSRSGGVAELV